MVHHQLVLRIKVMQKLHFKIIKLISLLIIAGLLLSQTNTIANFLRPNTAFAVGDLTVDWGIGTGDVGPIFTVNNTAPGNTESRTVVITNGAASVRPIGVKGIENTDTGDLSDMFRLVIQKDGFPVYGAGSPTGEKTVTQFFAESATPDGVLLFNQPSGNTSNYTFIITFTEDAGNAYQAQSFAFDLQIGLSIAVPTACSTIDFGTNEPIFGTQKSDKLNGTPGNDLIFALEGSDGVNGNGGNDCIVGGTGGDSLHGNNGNDIILGEDGSDTIKGQQGNDTLFGGNGSDGLEGEAGNDHLFGETGSDSAKGGAGTDECIAESKVGCEV